MSFLKNMLGKKETTVESYYDFWNWFQENEKAFHNVIKTHKNIEADFFKKLSPKLSSLREGFFYLTGMMNDHTAELIFTADGKIKNFVFIEELVESAPVIPGWKFAAHKPPMEFDGFSIDMHGLRFAEDNLSFYPVLHPEYPDEIEITVVSTDFNERNRDQVTNGVYIFLDNYLGELKFATFVDYLNVSGTPDDDQVELIPMKKLKDYLLWREKEFIEKYNDVRHSSENDQYTAFEATLDNDRPLIATMNTDLLRWDSKCSHPWILRVEINYGDAGNNGMPNTETYENMNAFEDQVNDQLRDADGYLNIGRQTADGVREVYFACKDFKRSSKVVSEIAKQFADRLNIDYVIYKDKYWRSFDRFGVRA
ncbi:DUF695 domain-containing protein [Pseudochryseolinea flava]|uniref:DUF695 domain-containing protein n=1 Tax=Pseudochryseolinea flava TaxID=2059302 RepID=A0A364Y6U2_9BACT|nr:DUF695 domain-containing protein [Pseudochryseolinea flava]RAW01818.1 DUF695 domain-containing protein [Pseudochryseolinea flava]